VLDMVWAAGGSDHDDISRWVQVVFFARCIVTGRASETQLLGEPFWSWVLR